MSIDARVTQVTRNQDGSGVLHFVDRQTRPGSEPEIARQKVMRFLSSPIDVCSLENREVRGNTKYLMLGDRMIARCTGYTTIEFAVDRIIDS